jgi:glycosyltransferase involved in cell wall biosynthesis
MSLRAGRTPVPPEGARVSVVMAAFNEEARIGEAIESVLKQTYRAFELIVVDDASDDRTAETAARFDRVRVVRRRHRGGVGAACNTGMEAAHGEYWTLFDADDVMPPDRLASGVEYLDANPSVGLVLGLTEAFITPGEPRPEHWNPAWDAGPFPACTGTMIARRNVFELVGGFDEQLPVASDVEWLARAKDAGVRAGRVESVWLHRRIHAGSASADHRMIRGVLLGVLRESVHRRRARVSC